MQEIIGCKWSIFSFISEKEIKTRENGDLGQRVFLERRSFFVISKIILLKTNPLFFLIQEWFRFVKYKIKYEIQIIGTQLK